MSGTDPTIEPGFDPISIPGQDPVVIPGQDSPEPGAPAESPSPDYLPEISPEPLAPDSVPGTM